MKNLIFLIIVVFFNLGSTYANQQDVSVSAIKAQGGIDFTYSAPEMFFKEPEILKLGAIWEILNCYAWEDGRPFDQCVNLEFYVVSSESYGDHVFRSILEGTGCFADGCDAIVELPLNTILNPVEYENYQAGSVVTKEITMRLAFGGEEDEFGRIVGRKFASAFYTLTFILNGTGFGSVSVISFNRSVTP
ncbi:MAG: hypothetical protein A2X86_13460 [Bdellovibrionales bacterium GWA2_49_15]|nr:MAG: hypothetical protein A2X86_13460 [Bdellovibrionales bacterium GWA2_49_15]HAZ13533.1 hypothetical protein [Bdellovibrionales bacterium]